MIEQYGALVGLPTWQPLWGFGFQLCRWGYASIADTREQVRRMREADIPLEVMWNDIDLYHDFRDFTTDPVNFPAEGMRDFIQELVSGAFGDGKWECSLWLGRRRVISTISRSWTLRLHIRPTKPMS